MRFDHDGISLWYGTADAPAPDETVLAGVEVSITIGVQPTDASNAVEVLFRVNDGEVTTLPGKWIRNDAGANAQYYRVTLPPFQAGDRVDYIAVCRCAGRTVPSREDSQHLASSFRVIEAAASKRSMAAPREGEPAPETPSPRMEAAAEAPDIQPVAIGRDVAPQASGVSAEGADQAPRLASPEEKFPDVTAPARLPPEPATQQATPEATIQTSVDTAPLGDRTAVTTKTGMATAFDPTQSTSVFQPSGGAPGLPQGNAEPVQPTALSSSGWKPLPPEWIRELQGVTTTLPVAIAPEAGVAVPETVGTIFVDAVYTRAIGGGADPSLTDLPGTIRETVRGALDEKLSGTLLLADVAPDSKAIVLDFLGANGSVRLRRTVSAVREEGPPTTLSTRVILPLSVTLSAEDVTAIVAPEPQPEPSPPQVIRRAYFVPVDDVRVPFEVATLQIAPVTVGDGGWVQQGFSRLFLADDAITTALRWQGALPAELAALPWSSFHLAVDGRFSFSFPKGAGDAWNAWCWWLTGPLAAIGVVLDDLQLTRVTPLGVALPPFSGVLSSEVVPGRVPGNYTEAEAAANPGIYTEDPGEFCKPFKNPERVLGERSFFVILRAEQPVISAQASVQQDPLPTFTNIRTATLQAYRMGTDAAFSGQAAQSALSAKSAGQVPGIIIDPVPGSNIEPAPGTLIDDQAGMGFVRHTLPSSYLDTVRRSDRGRTELDAANPIQWEGDVSRYQATTVARGHIVEFRMRWRSNGYSLGTVAKTLTLAPRQTKRIQKIEWRRSELARREEKTQLFDKVSDSLSRDRDYDDSVQANLSEWARGESESSMTAGAGGFGFAAGGFVIGGGGGGSNASSSSSQEGGRRTSASEEQRLRDSIRRYGDALRKLDSLVVSEVTQEETVTGTTEVVRNANYGHSLTVIYYQILRHLKIETGVAGVRECLFVPFAITPFTVTRAYRWREFIKRGLRDTQYAGAIQYLRDVMTNFANSDVPPGRRSDQPVRYIFGSLYIRLAIERPRDKDDGGFDPATWMLVQPYLGFPALSIYNRLKALVEAQRDAVFQQQHAGVIAASWVDTLVMKDAGGRSLNADFTLASRYQFNGVARVDFSITAPSGVTRETLGLIHVEALKALPPGSIANLQSLTFTYETDQFQRTVSASQGAEDLVTVETGVPEAGANVGTIPDMWERRDVRAEMIYAVQGLIEHLNEHVEYYTKTILWRMDRDRLFMLIDGFYVPGTNKVSIASVVERDPIAIIGNALVYRVAAGSFLGIGNIRTPAELFNYYVSLDAPSEPMLVSLPTDGLYAQTIMDECGALEEHFGNTDWALNDPDPALGEIAPELLASRRAEPQPTQPTQLPQTLINLQNAPEAPAPSGLAGVLAAVTTANAFRDMAGLAGTQANAAAAFQAAANLATNFGNQAAALKMAEIADKAHNAQTADQKLATVQRAADKNLVTGDEAQRHASQILESLHAPAAPLAPHETKAAGDFMDTVRSKLGAPLTSATMEASTPQGSFKVQLASAEAAPGGGGGAPPAAPPAPGAPPAAVANLPLGFDIFQSNGPANVTVDDFTQLKNLGKVFGIHKIAQTGEDTQFDNRYPLLRLAGLIRGSYDFFAPIDVDTQVGWVVKHVKRLTPGDLAPAIDLEETKNLDLDNTYNYRTTGQGRTKLFNDILKWLNDVETQLGRTPIIYTWNLWKEQFDPNTFPDAADVKMYPLWGTQPEPWNADVNAKALTLPAWPKATIWQYAEDTRGKKKDNDQKLKEWKDKKAEAEKAGTPVPPAPVLEPSILWGQDPYVEPGTEKFDGIDYDAFNGTIYELRGLADLGHTAPHLVGNLECVVYSEPDGTIHLLELLAGSWHDENLSSTIPLAPPAAGDPAAVGVGSEQVILYRDANGNIFALTRSVTDSNAPWSVSQVASKGIDDPFILVTQNDVHAVFWNEVNEQVHLLRPAGADWRTELAGDPDVLPPPPDASGSAVAYVFQDTLRFVSRAGPDGHLVDIFRAGGSRPYEDFTANSQDATGKAPPAATYRPTTYTPNGAAPRIVFRAVRGDIWQIERDTLVARNLSFEAGHAPASAGSPTAVFTDTAHIFYRSLDGTIIEMFDDAGIWRRRNVCVDAAADPTAYVAQGIATVSFRARDGSIRIARFANGTWKCENAIQPLSLGTVPQDESSGPLMTA